MYVYMGECEGGWSPCARASIFGGTLPGDEGVVSVVRVILYPAYGLGFLAFGAVVGSHFEESVGYRSEVNN